MTGSATGSIAVETEGTTIARGTYYGAFGEPQGVALSSFGYTAREPANPGYYYRARYYSPAIGRFLAEDPAGLYVGPNLYAYVTNNPVRFTDPFGLSNKDNTSPQSGKPYCDFGKCTPPVNPPAPVKPPKPGCSLTRLKALYKSLQQNQQAIDTWKHCLLGCEIAKACGQPAGWAASYGKEFLDVFGAGDAEASDVQATNAGVQCQSSALRCDCCCRNAGYNP